MFLLDDLSANKFDVEFDLDDCSFLSPALLGPYSKHKVQVFVRKNLILCDNGRLLLQIILLTAEVF